MTGVWFLILYKEKMEFNVYQYSAFTVFNAVS